MEGNQSTISHPEPDRMQVENESKNDHEQHPSHFANAFMDTFHSLFMFDNSTVSMKKLIFDCGSDGMALAKVASSDVVVSSSKKVGWDSSDEMHIAFVWNRVSGHECVREFPSRFAFSNTTQPTLSIDRCVFKNKLVSTERSAGGALHLISTRTTSISECQRDWDAIVVPTTFLTMTSVQFRGNTAQNGSNVFLTSGCGYAGELKERVLDCHTDSFNTSVMFGKLGILKGLIKEIGPATIITSLRLTLSPTASEGRIEVETEHAVKGTILLLLDSTSAHTPISDFSLPATCRVVAVHFPTPSTTGTSDSVLNLTGDGRSHDFTGSGISAAGCHTFGETTTMSVASLDPTRSTITRDRTTRDYNLTLVGSGFMPCGMKMQVMVSSDDGNSEESDSLVVDASSALSCTETEIVFVITHAHVPNFSKKSDWRVRTLNGKSFIVNSWIILRKKLSIVQWMVCAIIVVVVALSLVWRCRWKKPVEKEEERMDTPNHTNPAVIKEAVSGHPEHESAVEQAVMCQIGVTSRINRGSEEDGWIHHRSGH
ncbi:hypothetical protein BLNAU_18897 [Blattamonas nauphoetae]|uniref:Transmembrane protein family 132 middle domain-containing protein n=1 Tax=Blattamonas nauphoetae TaxID=2049346 RepID=A0ABQ9X3K3_9EUKA|nr:hypothetical protein BLNAU_18897 [Blattamonas nauphoetae]